MVNLPQLRSKSHFKNLCHLLKTEEIKNNATILNCSFVNTAENTFLLQFTLLSLCLVKILKIDWEKMMLGIELSKLTFHR